MVHIRTHHHAIQAINRQELQYTNLECCFKTTQNRARCKLCSPPKNMPLCNVKHVKLHSKSEIITNHQILEAKKIDNPIFHVGQNTSTFRLFEGVYLGFRV